MEYMAPFTVRFSQGSDSPCQELVAGKHFHLGLDAMEQLFWTNLSPRLRDFLRVAISVYVADRLGRRKQQSQERRWFRSLKLSVAVREPEFWESGEVLATLMECLDFLSEDAWDLKFVKDYREQPTYVARFLPGDNPFAAVKPLVCLYSGGLDSAAGLGIRIAENPDRPVIPVTVWHQPGQRQIVRRQQGVLKARYGTPIYPLIVKAAMVWSSELKEWKPERSQRCRSFLFAAVGAVAAVISEATKVEVFESGIGAINLPLLAGMVGSRATRGSHPHFFHLMSRLASLATGQEVAFHLPFIEKTKGQVVRQLARCGLKDLARSTISCVHYPLRERPHKQCGICPACLLRRQAMLIAGIKEPSGVYKYDLFGPAPRANRIREDRLEYLKAILVQVANLGPLGSGDRVPERVRRHLLGTNVISPGECLDPFIHLFSRYRHEWLRIAAKGMERGWTWANLLAPVGAALIGRENHASA